MSRFRVAPWLCCQLIVLHGLSFTASSQEIAIDTHSMPLVKFFYYDAADVEWAVSAETKSFQEHLESTPESQVLFETVSNAVRSSPEAETPAEALTRWIESERERYQQSRQDAVRFRMAEGIIAYLRAHDFSVSSLVEALKRRSGASDVELVGIHLRDNQGHSSYKLKVILVDPAIEVGKQGFNIKLRSPNASYAAVVYALGVALYEVHEVINAESSEDGTKEVEEIEPLPLPESLDGPILEPTPTEAGT